MSKQSTIEDRFGHCPYATAQSLISGKWAVLIMKYLSEGPVRFNELQRLMPKMSHATLSTQLKTLMKHGLVIRKEDPHVTQKVEYELSEIGHQFKPVLDAMALWGKQYIAYMNEHKEGEDQ